MSIIDSLSHFDLTKHEAQVYTELLKLGPTNAGPVIASTGLHRQFVYAALEKLHQRKLVHWVIKRGKKLFQAANPETLKELHEAKGRELLQLLPQLSALQSSSPDRLDVKVLYGREEFFRNLELTLRTASKTDKIVRIIGGAADVLFYEAIGSRYEDYRKLGLKLKVRKYLIAPESTSDVHKEKLAKDQLNILKTMKTGLSSPSFTRIAGDLTTIEIYGADVMVVQIFNAAVAKGFREHFEMLWQQARCYQ
ncbi:hypothetical protein JNK13_00245 [bacterium]|nr:hypothetical protein [bacterium]